MDFVKKESGLNKWADWITIIGTQSARHKVFNFGKEYVTGFISLDKIFSTFLENVVVYKLLKDNEFVIRHRQINTPNVKLSDDGQICFPLRCSGVLEEINLSSE